jgi:diaminohydroxyphosphoribosylaminopyrimidine deaminase/5-amino-6-(5-phosphoribosylamino)uracil reductase
MRRALELAAEADHLTSPNPMVGAVVIDRDGEPVGEGFHRRAGEAHGEAIAIGRAGLRSRGGTLYVNLEPCSHQGRTPPCTETVIAAAPARVVVALEDPDPRVAGSGVAALREAGIDVLVGVEEDAARRLNRFYLKHRTTGLPWVTVKFGASLDGRIATAGGESRWITGEAARRWTHGLRQRHDAIIAGAGTVVADDPELTNRLPGAARQPLRVVVDSTLRTPATARVLQHQDRVPTLVATTGRAADERKRNLAASGAEVLAFPTEKDGQRVDLESLLRLLAERGILSVLVEGGAELHGALFDANLVDGVVAILAPIVIGGRDAKGAVGGEGIQTLLHPHRIERVEVAGMGDDLIVSGDVHRDR